MSATIIAAVFSFSAIFLYAGAIVYNQLNPSYATALTIPAVNVISVGLAFIAVIIATLGYGKRAHTTWAKPVVVLAIGCAIVFASLLPIADLGYLSRVR